ncbi:hypothetical protein K426_14375 [Sphingobium sp. TKS]|nr:hypothetical protein K426_14375 [Sphingobium sp. TKS]
MMVVLVVIGHKFNLSVGGDGGKWWALEARHHPRQYIQAAHIHPAIIRVPPIGVTAPSHLGAPNAMA